MRNFTLLGPTPVRAHRVRQTDPLAKSKGGKKGGLKMHAQKHAREAAEACAVDFSKPYRSKEA